MSEELNLTKDAQIDRDQFTEEFGIFGGCACHLSPPCSWCVHPGNPLNQEEDESCWEVNHDQDSR